MTEDQKETGIHKASKIYDLRYKISVARFRNFVEAKYSEH